MSAADVEISRRTWTNRRTTSPSPDDGFSSDTKGCGRMQRCTVRVPGSSVNGVDGRGNRKTATRRQWDHGQEPVHWHSGVHKFRVWKSPRAQVIVMQDADVAECLRHGVVNAGTGREVAPPRQNLHA